MSNDAAVYAEKLLTNSFQKHASDIHFYPAPTEDIVFIYFRILGNRKLIQTISKKFYQIILTYFKFTSKMDIGELRKPQNGTITWHCKTMKETYDLRLSTLPVSNFESLTIRIFSQQFSLELEQLLLFPNQIKQMKTWIHQSSGIILFTGPTGSGKTTTMYALLEKLIHQNSYQIITLEDPIERKLDHVLQVEINEQAGISYQSGLKAVLRHDPDVLLIGEIRDEYTAKLAFRAALTGHLVLSTLHAANALNTIDRILELGVERQDLKQTLIAVAALKLLPIVRKGKIDRRAAIVETLDESYLAGVISGEKKSVNTFHSFTYLKEKALRYGYITDEIFKEA